MTELYSSPDFDGSDYDPAIDKPRLTKQIKRVYRCLNKNGWITLREIANATKDPEASISAQIRNLRKTRFGSYTIEKRRRGIAGGQWEYKLVLPDSIDH